MILLTLATPFSKSKQLRPDQEADNEVDQFRSQTKVNPKNEIATERMKVVT
jgi:hypothetical protein